MFLKMYIKKTLFAVEAIILERVYCEKSNFFLLYNALPLLTDAAALP